LHKDNHIPNKEANEYFEKGLQCIEKRDYANAKNAFLHADRICPNMPVILNAIGNSIVYTEAPENGVHYYEKALAVDSTFIKTYINFGCCLNNMRDYEKALILLDSAKAGGYHDQIANLAERAERDIRTKYAQHRLISANPHPRQ